MSKPKNIEKKILQLEDKLRKNTKKLAKLKAKLEKGNKPSLEKKSVKNKASVPAPKTKRKAITPEQRAKISKTLKAYWSAKKTGASSQNPSPA